MDLGVISNAGLIRLAHELDVRGERKGKMSSNCSVNNWVKVVYLDEKNLGG